MLADEEACSFFCEVFVNEQYYYANRQTNGQVDYLNKNENYTTYTVKIEHRDKEVKN
ncbi:hypothetical protein Hanom_Chr12g01084661 [Helianthus anomalus]